MGGWLHSAFNAGQHSPPQARVHAHTHTVVGREKMLPFVKYLIP